MDKNYLADRLLAAQKDMEQYKLIHALNKLEEVAQNWRISNFETEVYNLKNDYKWMLTFLEQGGVDPQREKMHHNFVLRTSNLIYRMRQQALLEQPNHYVGNMKRMMQKEEQHEASWYLNELKNIIALVKDVEQINEEMEDAATKLYGQLYEKQNAFFNYLLTADVLSDEDRKIITDGLNELPEHITHQLLHALFLNCCEGIDLNKVKIIRAFVGHSSQHLHLLALTLFLILYGNDGKWINLEPALRNSVSLLKDIPTIQQDMVLIQKQLLLSANTKETVRIMNEKIMPSILKSNLGQNLTGMNQINPSMLDDILSVDDETAKNIKSLRDMTMVGYDINYTMFQSTCRHFFFTKCSNWFCPFDAKHPDLNDNSRKKENQDFINKLSQSDILCELDKYGMASLISQLPEEMKNMMLSNAQLGEANGEFSADTPAQDITRVRNIIQCLYRFYEECNNSKEMKNIFAAVPMLHTAPKLMEQVNEAEFLKEMAQFYMKTKNYEQAQDTLKQLLKIQAADAWTLHALATTYRKAGDATRALPYEQQAELLEPDNLTIVQGLADLCAQLNKYGMCATYLRRIEEVQVLNEEQNQQLVHCLQQSKKYDELLKHCYKIKYLKGEDAHTDLLLAETMMQLNRISEAIDIYDKLEGNEAMQPKDYLYKGMAAWTNGQLPQAVTCMKRFAVAPDWETLWEEQAKDYLTRHDVSANDIILMQEILSQTER